ncbi:MAG: cupin-like domain-containing protein, partial [Steroidobacteraceae bacterium]
MSPPIEIKASLPMEIDAGELSSPERFQREVVEACRPAIIRGLVEDWPVVQAARSSPRTLREYLSAFDAGQRIEAFFGEPSIAGKYYYTADLKAVNFERRAMKLLDAIDAIVEAVERPHARSVYAGSVPTLQCLPGFAAGNPMPLLPDGTEPRIWLGTASSVASHYDTFDNLACVIAGRRRFTLYAPELIGRLYVGPIDNTLSGPPVSLAASTGGGQEFPLFEEVRAMALSAELEAGDAL